MIIYIPGWLSTYLTFPGVILHEISHRLMCDLLVVPVYEIRYFDFDSERAGHVIHGKTRDTFDSLLISVAPLFINSLICLILIFPFCASLYIIDAPIPHIYSNSSNFFSIILLWLGFSALVHAKPSNQDMESVRESHHFDPSPSKHITKIIDFIRFISFFRFFIIYFLMKLFLYMLFG